MKVAGIILLRLTVETVKSTSDLARKITNSAVLPAADMPTRTPDFDRFAQIPVRL